MTTVTPVTGLTGVPYHSPRSKLRAIPRRDSTGCELMKVASNRTVIPLPAL